MATGLFNLKQVNQAISQGAWSGYIAPRWVEYLVVAGGGAGGSRTGGGGGAGGLLTGIVTVAAGTSYTVTVGAGATGAGWTTQAPNGSNSVFGSISALGGGGAGAGGNGAQYARSGGSGGGGGGTYLTGGAGGQGTAGQGNAGGTFGSSTSNQSGGGGAGTVGLNGSSSATGNGGAGIASAITGTVVTYAGGGGAGSNGGTSGTGGVGGGASGTATDAQPSGASNNTGGGGGGGGYTSGFGDGGSGGSGIVVVRYPGNVQFYTGGTVTYSNGYIVHNFTANGTLAPTTPTVVSEYQISRSLRFNSADSPYLSRTPSVTSNQTTATFSAWVKRGTLGAEGRMFSETTGSGAGIFWVLFTSADQLMVLVNGSGTGITSTQVFRDPSAWYHIVAAVDTNQTTGTDRIKVYVNGAQITAFTGTQTYYTQGQLLKFNVTSTTNYIGYSNTAAFNGYMTEVNWIDGQQLTPTSFGYVSPSTGIWSPAKFVGAYGTNGAYLNFSDNSNTTAATLGKDYSGNGNNWTPNNFSVTAGVGNDSFVDSPTSYGTDTGVGGEVRGNYATLNPAAVLATKITLLNGNLQQGTVSGATYQEIPITLAVNFSGSNKWYAEVNTTTVSGTYYPSVAISSVNKIFAAQDIQGGATSDSTAYMANGQKYNNGSLTSYGSAFTSGDVVGIAVDEAAGTVVMYKNNVSQGTLASSLTGLQYITVTAHTGSNFYFNAGQRAFNYTAPSGFKALCTQNLPTPTIGATTATQAGKYFNPVLYTGNGGTNNITGVGFQPDWVWIKSRNDTYNPQVYDVLRGTNNRLVTANTNAEFSDTDALTSFNSDGFTSGAEAGMNANAISFVAWNWKANGTGVSNTAGSITSTVSANTTSGFSVVTYTNASSGTVGHGLGVAPAMVIYKDRTNNGVNWIVLHQSLANMSNSFLVLNLTNAASTGTALGGNPTSSVIYTNTNIIQNGAASVAYCFAEVAGYSKFGSYTGNGSTDGPFVFTGMRPAFLMTKRTDSATSGDWNMVDTTRGTYNVVGPYVYANRFDAEGNAAIYDILSNGFKIRESGAGTNASGGTYIYMAFASNPFKYSLAR
jgi:hypothetical protein